MDTENRFHTSETLPGCGPSSARSRARSRRSSAAHAPEVRWGRFVARFRRHRSDRLHPGRDRGPPRGRGAAIAPIYHHLYNLTHSYLTAGAVGALWALAIGGLEWAMLAVPIHLAGDRGLFGNFYKPASLPFEPAAPPGGATADGGAPMSALDSAPALLKGSAPPADAVGQSPVRLPRPLAAQPALHGSRAPRLHRVPRAGRHLISLGGVHAPEPRAARCSTPFLADARAATKARRRRSGPRAPGGSLRERGLHRESARGPRIGVRLLRLLVRGRTKDEAPQQDQAGARRGPPRARGGPRVPRDEATFAALAPSAPRGCARSGRRSSIS